MNKVFMLGRLTRDPEVRFSQGEESMAIARFSLAVDRRGNDQTADFINCVAFKKSAEAIDKYLHKGSKIAVEGHIQTGSYTNKDNVKVYTTDVIVDAWEFAESKGSQASESAPAQESDNFMNIPDDIGEDLPFN